MAIVSISEAAKLTGKNRRTLQRHIVAGRLTKTYSATGEEGIDISELIRVYGELNRPPPPHSTTPQSHASMSQTTAPIEPQNVAEGGEGKEPDKFIIENLKAEVKNLHALLDAKEENLKSQKDHIDSLKQAMLMLENKEKTPAPEPAPVAEKKSWWKVFS